MLIPQISLMSPSSLWCCIFLTSAGISSLLFITLVVKPTQIMQVNLFSSRSLTITISAMFFLLCNITSQISRIGMWLPFEMKDSLYTTDIFKLFYFYNFSTIKLFSLYFIFKLYSLVIIEKNYMSKNILSNSSNMFCTIIIFLQSEKLLYFSYL